jgi:hypothetical protein
MRTSIKGWQPYSKSKDGKARVDGFGVCRCFERAPEVEQSDETTRFFENCCRSTLYGNITATFTAT